MPRQKKNLRALLRDEELKEGDEEVKQNEDEDHSDSDGAPASGTAQKKPFKYLTTNLLSQRNITLADVIITDVSAQDIIELEQELIQNQQDIEDPQVLLDPKEVLNEAKKEGPVDTLVDYDIVVALAKSALKMYMTYKNQEEQTTS